MSEMLAGILIGAGSALMACSWVIQCAVRDAKACLGREARAKLELERLRDTIECQQERGTTPPNGPDGRGLLG